jgi:hypothetical protein
LEVTRLVAGTLAERDNATAGMARLQTLTDYQSSVARQFSPELLSAQANFSCEDPRKVGTAFKIEQKGPLTAGLSVLYCNAVVIVDRARSRRVTPVPGVIVAVFWRSLELLLGNAGTISAKLCVIF